MSLTFRAARVSLALSTTALALATWLAPTPAQACGGLFCDSGTQMPVDQSAEDVIFVKDGDVRETHIRINYVGEAENFAWVIPMASDTTPEFSVGSEAFFARLTADSAPTFPYENVGGANYCDPYWGQDTSGTGDDGGESGGDDGGPNVEDQGTVGSFEFAVLSGGTAESVMEWLNENGFQQDPDAEPILADYIAEGVKIAAIKLSADADSDVIHPIVIRYEGEAFCVPVKLTAIAAQEDMGIRLFGFDEGRLAPLNFDHVVPNYIRLGMNGWNPTSYDELITMAVDEAGGHAFVTEYSGPSEIVQSWGFWSEWWNAEAFVEIAPHLVTQELQSQGFFGQPLLAGIMRQFLPAPEGVGENDFWNNLDGYAELIDLEAWSGPDFAAALNAMIIEPGARANEILATRPTLTRMYTTVSPHEMTEDPLFFFRDGLEPVDRAHPIARESDCDERGKWTIDGEEFCELQYDTYPVLPDMPWASRVERIPAMGAPQVTLDNAEAIGEVIGQHNETVCTPEHDFEGNTDPNGETDGETDGAGQDSNKSGGCSVAGGEAPAGLGALMLFAFAGVRRRRR